MGKLIVTTGNYAKTGYLLKNSKQTIYSIEELCYCIMQNPELCDDYLYDEGLARYIRNTLGLKERGALLADLIQRGAPLKDLIIVVFCSCDYFTKEEIEEFLRELAKVERSEEWVRIKNKADSYLIHGNYRDALMYYRVLLKEKDNFGITSETLGDIYHNFAITLLHTDGFAEGADYFREAYERNNREETLKQYLLALRFSGDRVMYESALDIYQVSESISRWLDVAFFQTELETQEISDFNDLNHIRQLLKEGKTDEFYIGVKRMTEQMKEEYRKYNE